MNLYIWDCGCCDCGHEFEFLTVIRLSNAKNAEVQN